MIEELSVKRVPRVHESSGSYLIRMAVANGYPSKSWLTYIDRSLNRMKLNSSPESVSILQHVAGLTKKHRRIFEKSLVHQRLSKDLLVVSVRICPKCVKEKMYFDYMWQVAYVSACPFHGVKLIDVCPKCKLPLTWEIPGIASCFCGADFRKYPTTPADDVVLYYNQKLWAADGRKVPQIQIPGLPDNY